MDLNLRGKKALVCGASGGLGKAAAMALASEGVEIFLNARSLVKLTQTAEEIKSKTGITPVVIDADVSTDEGIKKIKSSVFDIDILVSNAGGPPPGQFMEHDEDKWSIACDLVLNSARKLTALVIEQMKERKFGRLIYITSIGVLQPVDDLILSNTYRAAVTGMAKTISNAYAKFGVTANCVCPGYTATERLENLVKTRAKESGVSEKEVLALFTKNIPAGRVGKPEELADLITFLASEKAAYITGTSIPVDGGFIKSLI